MVKVRELTSELAEARKHLTPVDKISWYYRHWKESGDDAKIGLAKKVVMPNSFIADTEWNTWMKDDPRNPQSQEAKD